MVLSLQSRDKGSLDAHVAVLLSICNRFILQSFLLGTGLKHSALKPNRLTVATGPSLILCPSAGLFLKLASVRLRGLSSSLTLPVELSAASRMEINWLGTTN